LQSDTRGFFLAAANMQACWVTPVYSDDDSILLRVVLAGKQPGVGVVAVAGDVDAAVCRVHEGAHRSFWVEEALQRRQSHT
jgi:hypothetical protein